jgi:hypothetical protein
MSNAYMFEVLVSDRVDNLLAEADREQLAALARSTGAERARFAVFGSLVSLLPSQLLANALGAVLSRTVAARLG